MSNPFLRRVGHAPLAEKRSLELRGTSSIITITVRSLAVSYAGRTRVTLTARIKSAILRMLNRVGSLDETERLQPAELPPQLIVLSHYQQALQGLSGDEELAGALGVTPSEVRSWKTGSLPSESKLRLLRDLSIVVSRLLEYYDPRAVPDWLHGRNTDLGGRQPIEVLREDGLAEVLSAADAQISGAYI